MGEGGVRLGTSSTVLVGDAVEAAEIRISCGAQ